MRSSASLGASTSKGGAIRSSSATRSGRQPFGQVVDRLLVDLAQPHPALLVERCGRTSSSSVFTIEPMRSTLAGSLTDSVRVLGVAVPPDAAEDLVG